MAEAEINAFLSHLAVEKHVSASTQNQALSALLFLYRYVIGRDVGDLDDVIRARKPKRLPVVMTREEVKAVLNRLSGKLTRQLPDRHLFHVAELIPGPEYFRQMDRQGRKENSPEHIAV